VARGHMTIAAHGSTPPDIDVESLTIDDDPATET
jgi:hypothetical protein